MLQLVLDTIPVRVFWKDRNLNYLGCNKLFAQDAGLQSPDEIIGKNDLELGWTQQAERYRADDREIIDSGRAKLRYEEPQTGPGGEQLWLETSKIPLTGSHGEIIGVLGTYVDITERKRTLLALTRSEQKLALHVQQTPLAVIEWSTDFEVVEWNPGASKTFGYAREAALGRRAFDLIVPREAQAEVGMVWRALLANRGGSRSTNRNITKDGKELLCEWYNTPLIDAGGEVMGVASLALDITESALAAARIEQLAYFDELSGLPNRRMLLDRMSQQLTLAERHGYFGALVFLDLDNFKAINDSLGHSAGDELLKQVAGRLSALVRAEDTVGRLGGDEFVVMLPNLSGDRETAAERAHQVAQKLLTEMASPYNLHGYEQCVTTSIGIVLFPENRESLDDLLKHADRAMYQSKFAGRNTIRHYRQVTTTPSDSRLLLEQELRAALEKGELCVYFQPQVSAVSGEVIGAEALLRWQHPRYGLLYPDKFIPLAQETNLIVPIGQWVMDATLTHAKVWEANGLPGCFQGVSVNVSPRQFCWPDFVPYVARLLEKYHPERVTLNLEITEGIVMGDLEATVEKMRRLKGLGVTLSVQDFGTGYSSLASLSRLPLDQLKIDAVFVAGIGVDRPSVAIVESILSLARNLGLGIVAEGVETCDQLAFLKARGCDAYQGSFAMPPMPEREFQALLAAHGGAGMPSDLRGRSSGRGGKARGRTGE